MKTFIATFYSHFGAIHFSKLCENRGIEAKMMPVPRKLSSSCGTCVRFYNDEPIMDIIDSDEVEQLVECEEETYIKIYPLNE